MRAALPAQLWGAPKSLTDVVQCASAEAPVELLGTQCPQIMGMSQHGDITLSVPSAVSGGGGAEHLGKTASFLNRLGQTSCHSCVSDTLLWQTPAQSRKE